MFKFLQSVAGAKIDVPTTVEVIPRERVEIILSTVTIFTVAALAHALFIPWLGYYWDDWINLWDGLALGHGGMVFQMSWDRAFFAVWHGVVFSIIGDHTMLWHVYFFALVVAGGLLLVWALRGLWPERRFATTAVALLYVVYPGFLGHPYAYLYHIHFFALAMGIFSLGISIRALQTPKRRTRIFYIALAMLSGATYLFLYEIYISFEVLRLLLLTVLLRRQGVSINRVFFTRLGKTYLPYLLIVLGFVFWQVFFFKSVRTTTDLSFILSQYQSDFVGRVSRIPGELIRDFLDTAVFAWFVPAHARASQTMQRTLLVSVLVGLSAAASVLLYARWTRQITEDTTETRKPVAMRWAVQITLIGLVATLLALMPAIFSHVNLHLLELVDRFTLTAVIPVAMLVIGLIYLCSSSQTRPWLIAALVGIAVMTHFNNGNYYRNVWKDEMNLWWQMSWRAPALQPGTVLAVSVLPASFYPVEPHEVWAPANLIYVPDAHEQPAIFGLRLTDEIAKQIMSGQADEYVVQKTLHFAVDYDQTLILSAPNDDSCLHVIDGKRLEELPVNAPAVVSWTASRSDINRIIADAPSPKLRASIFGNEPPHTWCYYFQKAELARQMDDWEAVASLGDEVRQLDFAPKDTTEWLPFIQGYAEVGRCEDVRQLSAILLDALPVTQANGLSAACEG